VIATGACTISGGPFVYQSYTTVRGVDTIIPVDVYVPGCPPRPEALFYGILTLQKMIRQGETVRHPDIRQKPVLAALPPDISMEDLSKEMEELLLAPCRGQILRMSAASSLTKMTPKSRADE
jgi:NADH:ubiquinone oxidoreductase subunit B-like Fe-S oxidoreductase